MIVLCATQLPADHKPSENQNVHVGRIYPSGVRMFDVNRSIDDLIAAGELDPLVIATKVADQVPLNDLRSLVAVLIRQRVRDRFE